MMGRVRIDKPQLKCQPLDGRADTVRPSLLKNGRHPMFKSPDGRGSYRMLKLSA